MYRIRDSGLRMNGFGRIQDLRFGSMETVRSILSRLEGTLWASFWPLELGDPPERILEFRDLPRQSIPEHPSTSMMRP